VSFFFLSSFTVLGFLGVVAWGERLISARGLF
jgi:hypothetical protein